MAPHPSLVMADISIEASYPRTEEFFTSRLYNQYFREVATSLREATALTSYPNHKTVTDNHPQLNSKIYRDWGLNEVLGSRY